MPQEGINLGQVLDEALVALNEADQFIQSMRASLTPAFQEKIDAAMAKIDEAEAKINSVK